MHYLYRIGLTANGFEVLKFEVDTGGISSPVSVYSSQTQSLPMNISEVDLSPDGTKLAFANSSTGSSNRDVILIHLNPTTGNLDAGTGNQGDGTSIYDINNAAAAFTGVEFSSNGQYLFVGQKNTGIRRLDLATGLFTSVLNNSDIYGDSQLERAYHPQGDEFIYAVHDDGTRLGRILNVYSQPAPNFQPDILLNITAASTAGGNTISWFLPDQIDGLDYSSIFNSNTDSSCCVATAPYNAATYSLDATSATWTPSSNPFGSSNWVYIKDELRIPQGRELLIQGMNFAFGPEGTASLAT